MEKKMDKVIIQSRYNQVEVPKFVCKSPSRTKSEFKNECDINKIIARAKKTGQLPISDRVGRFLDMEPLELLDAMNMVIQGQSAFESLPASTRNRFANDPIRLLSFLGDPSNRDEAIKLGLVDKKEVVKDGNGDNISPVGDRRADIGDSGGSKGKKEQVKEEKDEN